MMKNRVYIVGAGPGDPELLTLAGKKVLKEAEVVIYDNLVDRRVLRYANKGAEYFCANRECKEVIPYIILKKWKEGKRIVRLKGGDPFIFGRAKEELSFLRRHGIPFSVIPGVTSATAAACLSGIPLTVRGVSSSVIFVTGHESPQKNGGFINWEDVARADTIVLYMAVQKLPEIVSKLMALKGKSTPIAIVEKVSTPFQRVITSTLEDVVAVVQRHKISAPAIVIIGKVVKYEREFNWFKDVKKVLYTGIFNREMSDSELMFHLPLVEIRPLRNLQRVVEFIKDIERFDCIIFSTPHTVSHFFQRLFELGVDSRILSGVKVACGGRLTLRELKSHGILPDIIPDEEEMETLLEKVRELNPKRVGILLPGAGDRGLLTNIKKLGVEVYGCRLYTLGMPEALPDLEVSFFDEIIFPGPSYVRNFLKRYGVPPSSVKVVTTNRKTYEEARKLGLIPMRRWEYAEVV